MRGKVEIAQAGCGCESRMITSAMANEADEAKG